MSVVCQKNYTITVHGNCPKPAPLGWTCPSPSGKEISWPDGFGPIFADDANRVAAESDDGVNQIAMIDFTIPVPAVDYYLAGPTVGAVSHGMFYDWEVGKIISLTRNGAFPLNFYTLSIFDPITGLIVDIALPELATGTTGWFATFSKVIDQSGKVAMVCSSSDGHPNVIYLINTSADTVLTHAIGPGTTPANSSCYCCATKQVATYRNASPFPVVEFYSNSTLALENTWAFSGVGFPDRNGQGLIYVDSVGKLAILGTFNGDIINYLEPTNGAVLSTITTPDNITAGAIFYDFARDSIMVCAKTPPADTIYSYNATTQALKCTTQRVADISFPFWIFARHSDGLPYCLDAGGSNLIHELSSFSVTAYYTLDSVAPVSGDVMDSVAGLHMFKQPGVQSPTVPALISNGLERADLAHTAYTTGLVAALAYPDTGGWSEFGWFKILGQGSANVGSELVAGVGNGSIFIDVGNTDNPANVEVSWTDAAFQSVQTYIPLSTGAWHFFHLYYDPVAHKVGISFDNGAATLTGTGVSFTPQINGVWDFFGPLVSFGVDVVWDEIGLKLDRKLTSAEQAFLYNSGAGRTWPL